MGGSSWLVLIPVLLSLAYLGRKVLLASLKGGCASGCSGCPSSPACPVQKLQAVREELERKPRPGLHH
jgi:hypothetical protein